PWCSWRCCSRRPSGWCSAPASPTSGPGRRRPPTARPPCYPKIIGATGPKMLALAGEIAAGPSRDAGLEVGGDDGSGLGDRLDPAELGLHVTGAVGSDARGAEVSAGVLVGMRGRHGELGGGAVDPVVPERI